jgi:hypothetical protein
LGHEISFMAQSKARFGSWSNGRGRWRSSTPTLRGTYAGRRGTVQHDVLEGTRAVPFGDGDAIELVVSCRADAGELYTDVPYAVLVTLEVPSGIGLPVYQEVRARLRAPVRVRPQTR